MRWTRLGRAVAWRFIAAARIAPVTQRGARRTDTVCWLYDGLTGHNTHPTQSAPLAERSARSEIVSTLMAFPSTAGTAGHHRRPLAHARSGVRPVLDARHYYASPRTLQGAEVVQSEFDRVTTG
jgi:hypothetical protein